MAVLKKGLSFDYISENRFFTGADSYTLSITFPLAGCPQNVGIFGHINRKDYDLEKLLLDCEIHDRNFNAYGSISIVDINDKEVKTQFLEGRSATNFYSSFDNVYINEIQMPSLYRKGRLGSVACLRSYHQQREDINNTATPYYGFVVFPWVNNTSGNVQNKMVYDKYTGTYSYYPVYESEVMGQPFLMEVLEQVFSSLGYSLDASKFNFTQWENIVICNSIPVVWKRWGMNDVLPHWTVTEFLEQIELFIGCEFVINNHAKTVKVEFLKNSLKGMPLYQINNVVDEYKVEVKAEGSHEANEYIEHRNMAYAECSHQMWKFYSCPWLHNKTARQTWNNIAEMRNALQNFLVCQGPLDHDYYKRVHYCKAEKSFFILRCYYVVQDFHKLRIIQVDNFSPRITKGNANGERTELKIVPACIDFAGEIYGDMLFLDCGEYDTDLGDDDNVDQTVPANLLSAGEKEQQEAFFDKLYVGFWSGIPKYQEPYMPHPIVDKYEFLIDGTLKETSYTMRLHGENAPAGHDIEYEVDQSHKYTFSFLSDSIPEVKSIFYIHGKRYLAEKITATFTEKGMSQKMKMVCYRMKEPE